MVEQRLALRASAPMLPRSGIHRMDIPAMPWRLIPIILVVLAILVGPYVAPSPTAQSLASRLTPPFGFGGSSLGSDGLGRDMLARILVGSRNSLQISLIAATGASVVGIFAGMVSGMIGGWTDRIVTLLVETVLAVPFITVGLVVTATIGQSSSAVIVLLIGTGWITHARILRGLVRVLTRSEFVRASQAMGGGRIHIMLRHILPNILPVSIVVFFQQIGSMLLWSASLTWLGIGMPIEHISLGGIIRDGQELLYNGWWVSTIGGLAIVFIVTALNLAADWWRIRLDPEQRGYRG